MVPKEYPDDFEIPQTRGLPVNLKLLADNYHPCISFFSGYINPRSLVRAFKNVGKRNGVNQIDDVVCKISKERENEEWYVLKYSSKTLHYTINRKYIQLLEDILTCFIKYEIIFFLFKL